MLTRRIARRTRRIAKVLDHLKGGTTDDQAVLYDEDFPLLRGSQEAMKSVNAGPMLLGRNELVNHIFRRELHN